MTQPMPRHGRAYLTPRLADKSLLPGRVCLPVWGRDLCRRAFYFPTCSDISFIRFKKKEEKRFDCGHPTPLAFLTVVERIKKEKRWDGSCGQPQEVVTKRDNFKATQNKSNNKKRNLNAFAISFLFFHL